MAKPFTGEMMICCMCGKKQLSDPRISSDWTLFDFGGGNTYYVCPDELPLNGGTAEDLERAYARIFERVLSIRSTDQ